MATKEIVPSSKFEVLCMYCQTHIVRDQSKTRSVDAVCQKCDEYAKKYGKPKRCECCHLKSAFKGNKCRNCFHQEQQFGKPVKCGGCQKTCAFNRGHAYKSKMDGKYLCWLCIEKTKRTSTYNTLKITSKCVFKRPNGGSSSSTSGSSIASSVRTSIGDSTPMELDGLPTTPDSISSMEEEMNLRAMVSSLKKQLKEREERIAERNRKLDETKLKNVKSEETLRSKIEELKKEFTDTVDPLQAKIKKLQDQLPVVKKGTQSRTNKN